MMFSQLRAIPRVICCCVSKPAYSSKKVEVLAAGLAAGRRDSLAKAITLIESQRDDHREEAEWLLDMLRPSDKQRPLPYTLRIGVAGSPGEIRWRTPFALLDSLHVVVHIQERGNQHSLNN